MILYKAYHLGHGLGLIMVILHQHTQQIRIKISCQEKYILTQILNFGPQILRNMDCFVKLLKLNSMLDITFIKCFRFLSALNAVNKI